MRKRVKGAAENNFGSVITVRLASELIEYINDRAEKEVRTFNNMVIKILTDEMRRDTQK